MIKGCGTASEDQLNELAFKNEDVYFSNISYPYVISYQGKTCESFVKLNI